MSKKIITIVAIIALVAILAVCLVACNAQSYTKKLEKKGYTVTSFEADESAEYDAEWGVVGIKKGDGILSVPDTVTVIKFKKTQDAKDYEAYSKELGLSVYRTGKIVIAGSEAGVKAAK